VDETNGASTYTTTYSYTPNDLLASVTDALSNVRTFTYDGIGRRLTAEDLHASGDGTYGTWTYDYDDAGNLTEVTDPNSQTIDYTYDKLNRVLSEDYTGQAGTEVTYSYDGCTYGIGRLCGATTTDAGTNYLYDALGNVASELRTVNSDSFTTSFSYDRQGNQTAMTYPDGTMVAYNHNAAGELESVSKKDAGAGTFTDVVSEFDYAPTGQVSYILYGNGVETTNTYDASELYRLRTKSTTFCDTCGGMEAPTGWLPHSPSLTTPTLSPLAQAVFGESASEMLALASTAPVDEKAIVHSEWYRQSGSAYVAAYAQDVPQAGKIEVEMMKDRPQVRLRKWNGEVDLGIGYNVSAPASLTDGSSRVEWAGTNETVRAYPLAPTEDMEAGGFEIDLVLNDVPTTNIFDFSIDGTSDLNFFKQRALTEQEIADGAIRPENVVGSYAVYHKTKRDHVEGETNYGTGKVFHIYRPKVTDATGENDWGELSYDEKSGTLSVTVPQDFLDKATYPVIVDPTFGYGSIGASSANTGNAAGSLFTLSEAGTVTQISVYTKAASGSVDIGAALYADSSGAPDALLTSHSSAESQGTTPSWVDVAVTSYAAGADDYWIWGWGSASHTIYWDDGSTNQYNIQGMSWPDWDDPMTPGTYFDRVLSLYATYSTAAPSTGVIQNMDYTYDAVGNITNITDNSATGAGKDVVFGYDDLYRLTSASTTAASSTPFSRTYTYNSIGNITNKSDQGDYTYSGDGYANPHAATDINGTALTYDHNGNVTSFGDNTYEWDYRNRLIAAGSTSGSPATTTHLYDENLVSGWLDWSWNTTITWQSTEEAYAGSNSAKVVYTSPWGGLYFHTNTPVDATEFSDVRFAIKTTNGSIDGTDIEVGLYDTSENLFDNLSLDPYLPGGILPDDTWTEVSIPLSTYGATSTSGVSIQVGTTTTVYFDEVRFANDGDSATAATYGYDHTDQRVLMGTASATTTYANRYYNVTDTGVTTEHIFGPAGMLLATIEGNGTATSTRFIHPDHLGGTNVVTDESGDVVEVTDYYPYGDQRINDGTFTEQRKFIGEEYDASTGLSYLNARYYDGGRGQFTKQDEVFWQVGLTRDGNAVLTNPQLQNSYSYAGNNPINSKDPSGRCAWDACALETSPIWVPVAITGGAALIAGVSYYAETTTHALSRFGERWAGQVQTVSNRILKIAEDIFTPANPNPKLNPKEPLWKTAGKVCLVACPLIEYFYEAFKNEQEGADDFVRRSQPVDDQEYIQNPPSQQTPYYSAPESPSLTQPRGSTGGSYSPGLLPRSTNPVGYENSGAPIYCWGACGN
jgi:RHS repeat-associated protein